MEPEREATPEEEGNIIDNLLKEIRTGTTLRATQRKATIRRPQLNQKELDRLKKVATRAEQVTSPRSPKASSKPAFVLPESPDIPSRWDEETPPPEDKRVESHPGGLLETGKKADVSEKPTSLQVETKTPSSLAPPMPCPSPLASQNPPAQDVTATPTNTVTEQPTTVAQTSAPPTPLSPQETPAPPTSTTPQQPPAPPTSTPAQDSPPTGVDRSASVEERMAKRRAERERLRKERQGQTPPTPEQQPSAPPTDASPTISVSPPSAVDKSISFEERMAKRRAERERLQRERQSSAPPNSNAQEDQTTPTPTPIDHTPSENGEPEVCPPTGNVDKSISLEERMAKRRADRERLKRERQGPPTEPVDHTPLVKREVEEEIVLSRDEPMEKTPVIAVHPQEAWEEEGGKDGPTSNGEAAPPPAIHPEAAEAEARPQNGLSDRANGGAISPSLAEVSIIRHNQEQYKCTTLYGSILEVGQMLCIPPLNCFSHTNSISLQVICLQREPFVMASLHNIVSWFEGLWASWVGV